MTSLSKLACVTGMGGLGALASLFAGPPLIVGLLGNLGFGTAGVVAASFAAMFQSIVYGGATGGVFSILQAIGATGAIGTLGSTLLGLAGGILGSMASLFFWRE